MFAPFANRIHNLIRFHSRLSQLPMSLLIRVKNAIKMLLSKDMVFELSFEEALRLVGRTNIRFFVQVGSNDGKKNDPLYPYVLRDGWKGILAEPDPINFQNLQKTYGQHSGLIFENVGIAPVNGE